jgi:hypothetical protein
VDGQVHVGEVRTAPRTDIAPVIRDRILETGCDSSDKGHVASRPYIVERPHDNEN